MGVDFTLLMGLGFLIPVKCMPDDDEDSMSRFVNGVYDHPAIGFSTQDLYGSQDLDFTPYAFVSFTDTKKTIYSDKIGGTPLSLILHGVYCESNIIKGGAVKPLAICCREERDLWEEAIEAKAKMIEALKSVDEEIAKLIETHGVFGEWLFSYFS
jgi:hypothetical protein